MAPALLAQMAKRCWSGRWVPSRMPTSANVKFVRAIRPPHALDIYPRRLGSRYQSPC